MKPAPSGTVLLLPGLWNSGPEHWQSHWEAAYPNCRRVVQEDWETPNAEDWIERLQEAVSATDGPMYFAAHSLACCLVVHWASMYRGLTRGLIRGGLVQGALLVAPSDTEAPSYPPGTTGFQPMPMNKLPFPAIVAASTDDPYVSAERAQVFADAWGAELALLGPRGHIGTAAKLGMWEEGMQLLMKLQKGR